VLTDRTLFALLSPLAAFFFFAANFSAFRMIYLANQRLPEGEKIRYLDRNMPYRRKFRKLYPANPLVWWHDISAILFFPFFFAAGWVFFRIH
jgi:hypothetical protein